MLRKVAKILQEISEYPGIFVARYGGDEFVLIYENYTVDEVENYVIDIKRRVQRLAITHKFSRNPEYRYITVSQGAVCKQPTENTKNWDYLATADRLLYEAKNAGKNDYRIGDKF